jgi:cysteinyl-tRNA synthetase
MTLRIHDSLKRQKSAFTPLTPGRVKIYLCGPTVYADPHLGHARSAVVFDVVRRYLEFKGYAVTLVRNVTDIDDKLLKRAQRRDVHYRVLATRCLHRYQTAMTRLNVIRPEVEPKATDHIAAMQALIATLVQHDHAYMGGGSVYFSTPSFAGYGSLSGRRLATSSPVERQADGGGKRHPADFVLWKAAKPEEPFWPSPWGPGRPGWHIECSAMSTHLLGPRFDIHGGGMDLIFPHHENEIAQSESVFGKTPANYWMHHGLVLAEGGKISKSRGRFESLVDLLYVYPPDAVRLFLLSKRYRHPLKFSPLHMAVATKNLAHLQRFFACCELSESLPDPRPPGETPLYSRFRDAMDDDFNFPQALALIFAEIRRINRGLVSVTGGSIADRAFCQRVRELKMLCQHVLGLRLNRSKDTWSGYRRMQRCLC